LIKFAKQHNFNESFSQICFVESNKIHDVSSLNLHWISRRFIFDFDSYETRFDELLNEGYSWINMNLAGILEDSLFIIIEPPNYKNNIPIEFVAVNFSLPAKEIVNNDWNMKPFYQIID
jgi:hypothetical protein